MTILEEVHLLSSMAAVAAMSGEARPAAELYEVAIGRLTGSKEGISAWEMIVLLRGKLMRIYTEQLWKALKRGEMSGRGQIIFDGILELRKSIAELVAKLATRASVNPVLVVRGLADTIVSLSLCHQIAGEVAARNVANKTVMDALGDIGMDRFVFFGADTADHKFSIFSPAADMGSTYEAAMALGSYYLRTGQGWTALVVYKMAASLLHNVRLRLNQMLSRTGGSSTGEDPVLPTIPRGQSAVGYSASLLLAETSVELTLAYTELGLDDQKSAGRRLASIRRHCEEFLREAEAGAGSGSAEEALLPWSVGMGYQVVALLVALYVGDVQQCVALVKEGQASVSEVIENRQNTSPVPLSTEQENAAVNVVLPGPPKAVLGFAPESGTAGEPLAALSTSLHWMDGADLRSLLNFATAWCFGRAGSINKFYRFMERMRSTLQEKAVLDTGANATTERSSFLRRAIYTAGLAAEVQEASIRSNLTDASVHLRDLKQHAQTSKLPPSMTVGPTMTTVGQIADKQTEFLVQILEASVFQARSGASAAATADGVAQKQAMAKYDSAMRVLSEVLNTAKNSGISTPTSVSVSTPLMISLPLMKAGLSLMKASFLAASGDYGSSRGLLRSLHSITVKHDSAETVDVVLPYTLQAPAALVSAITYLQTGDPVACKEELSTVMGICNQRDLINESGMALLVLSHLSMLDGDIETARTFLETAHEIVQRSKNPHIQLAEAILQESWCVMGMPPGEGDEHLTAWRTRRQELEQILRQKMGGT
eukprot:Clim_evm107s147 gene=Clim_evmTU107s147